MISFVITSVLFFISGVLVARLALKALLNKSDNTPVNIHDFEKIARQNQLSETQIISDFYSYIKTNIVQLLESVDSNKVYDGKFYGIIPLPEHIRSEIKNNLNFRLECYEAAKQATKSLSTNKLKVTLYRHRFLHGDFELEVGFILKQQAKNKTPHWYVPSE